MPRILIIIDPEETRHSALNRIGEVPLGDIQFKVVYYLQTPGSAKNACDLSQKISAKTQELESLVLPFRKAGHQIETEIKLFHRLYEAIIHSAYEHQADFVFKPLRQHGALRRALFTSTDWNLIRFCPCPLLLVNHANPITGKPVLAAVDLASEDDAHAELNEIVLEQTKVLASILDADIHLVHAYSLMAVPTGIAMSDPLAYQVSRGRREEQFRKAKQLTRSCEVPEKQLHLREGPADEVVNRCAAEIDAGVIVVGTVARSGPAGLFIGNTAESVIEKTRSDVFVVKQPDFESPIKAA